MEENPMEKTRDVLGLGIVAVDDLLYLERFPTPDSKIRLLGRERQCGGLTATALVAASRLGARTSFAGSLGDDELSRFAAERLRAAGVDLSMMRILEGARPCHSTIIVEGSAKTRTILFSVEGFVGASEEHPPAETIRSARVLFVDHGGVAGMIRAASIARAAGVPVVADLEREEDPRFGELLSLVDHPILSRDFARRITGEEDPARAALRLWASGRETVVVTAGGEGAFWVAADDPTRIRHLPAYPVEVVDTTGCGDVFHGAYAAALARGCGVEERIRFASAAAALKATAPGGQAGIPTGEAVVAYLRRTP
jgi:sugar/nucleoside kinase (ribokinase family)